MGAKESIIYRLVMGPLTPTKNWPTGWTFWVNCHVEIMFSKFSGVDSLINFTRDKVPCDMQAFADDIALLATFESPSSNGRGGQYVDVLRDTTQRSLNALVNGAKKMV